MSATEEAIDWDEETYGECRKLFESEVYEFKVLSRAEHDASRPLVVLVHPGDAIQTRDDVYGCEPDLAAQILEYSEQCQLHMGLEILELDEKEDVDLVVVHRLSSGYAFDGSGVVDEYAESISAIHHGGTVLWGDDLQAVADWLVKEMQAADRPSVLLSGAWCDEESGCVTAVGKALESAGAPVSLSHHACVSPDGEGDAWVPASRAAAPAP